ncbi:MAG: N-acetylmuramoyl-L-alanine amidase [Bacteroidota bacterium]
MSRFFLLMCVLLISANVAQSQTTTQRSQISIDLNAKSTQKKGNTTLHTSQIYPILYTFNAEPFLAYSVTQSKKLVQLEIRFSDYGDSWTGWTPIEEDAHQGEGEAQWVSQLQFVPPNRHYFQYRWHYLEEGQKKPEIELHLYNPGKSAAMASTNTSRIEERSCPCPPPDIQGRADWCPAGNCPRDATPAPHNVTHLIIHHSAGANGQDDWAAVVRSIWDFHVNTRRWDDIGYNWLVDPDGVIYEGRGEDVIGAHFCGQNTGTEAICVLGDYTFIQPSLEAINSVVEWLSWKSCQINAYPIDRVFHPSSGRQLLQVSGHRDGCATACPGDSFYPLLDEVRAATIQYRDNNCSISSVLTAPYALMDSVFLGEAVELVWQFDMNAEDIDLVVERSVGENYRYEKLARLNADARTYRDANIEDDNVYFYRVRAESNGEASAYSNIVTVSTSLSSTENIWSASTISLFPNPAANTLQIQIEDQYIGAFRATILSVNGQVLRHYDFRKDATFWQTELAIDDLSSGLYFLQMERKNEVGHLRFLKE